MQSKYFSVCHCGDGEQEQNQTESGMSTNPPGSIPGALTTARSCLFRPWSIFFAKGLQYKQPALYPLVLGVTYDKVIEKAKTACQHIGLAHL